MSNQTFAAGRYRGRMIAAHLGKSKTKETMQIAFTFNPIGKYGSNPDADLETCAGDIRTIFKYLTPNTVDYVVANLQSLGYDRETFAEIDSDHASGFPWAGIEFDATLKYETFEGNEKERWDFPLKGIGGKPLDDREVRGLDAQYGAALRKPANGAANPNASRGQIDPAADAAKAAAGSAASEKEAFDRF